jgi:hypothetical protein
MTEIATPHDPRLDRTARLRMTDLTPDQREAWEGQVVEVDIYPDVRSNSASDCFLSVLREPTNGCGWFLTSNTAHEMGLPVQFVGYRVWWVDETKPGIADLLATTPPEYARDLADAHVTVTRLEAELAAAKAEGEALQVQLNAQIDAYRRMTEERDQAVTLHRADIETISAALLEEAENRQWCDSYDEFVEDVNRSLNVALEVREVEWEVVLKVEVTLTKVVTAKNEDAARESAEEAVSAYDLRDCDIDAVEFVEAERQ